MDGHPRSPARGSGQNPAYRPAHRQPAASQLTPLGRGVDTSPDRRSIRQRGCQRGPAGRGAVQRPAQLGTMFTVKPDPLKVSLCPPVDAISHPMLMAVHLLLAGR